MPLTVQIHTPSTSAEERSLRSVLQAVEAELPDKGGWTIVVAGDDQAGPAVTAYPDQPAPMLDVYGWRVRAESGPGGGIPVYTAEVPHRPHESSDAWTAKLVDEMRVLFAVLRESHRQRRLRP